MFVCMQISVERLCRWRAPQDEVCVFGRCVALLDMDASPQAGRRQVSAATVMRELVSWRDS